MIVLSDDPLAKIVSFSLKVTVYTDSACPFSVTISALVSMFQSLIVLSSDPLARIVPLLLKATEFTLSLCPFNMAINVLVSTFQSFIILLVYSNSYDLKF